MALLNAGDKAKNSTVFVTLEPCCHVGRTGSCVEALRAAGVSSVVIPVIDPNPLVAGKGVQGLVDAGIDVTRLIDFELQAREINLGFFKRYESERPYVRLKLAMSIDGRTALANGESKWISGTESRKDVQSIRRLSDAVVTGVGTVLSDNPQLNVRDSSDVEPVRQPLRVVLDTQLRTPVDSLIFEAAGPLLFLFSGEGDALAERAEALRARSSNVERVTVCDEEGRADIASVLKLLLEDYGCNEVLIEAGATLAGGFISGGLVDELIIYLAPKLLGSDGRPLLDFGEITSMDLAPHFVIASATQFGEDLRVVFKR
jgi:diaminohydroxyphosphoribosylaminopyrimidine deaminase/5-amino-6-(5-phosphoribosylamino)uracil reductase